jgi:hypothetical protein
MTEIVEINDINYGSGTYVGALRRFRIVKRLPGTAAMPNQRFLVMNCEISRHLLLRTDSRPHIRSTPREY